jgi:hypothetical protein
MKTIAMKKSSLSLALFAALSAQTSLQALAAPAPTSTTTVETEKLLSQADLVFAGKVVDVQYKDSTDAIPFTFVTYEIGDTIAGRADGSQITLRFIGGRQQKGEVTRFLKVSELPEFRVGDSDVVFARKNGTSVCPLVSCADGRFRNRDGVLVNNDGFAVVYEDGEYATSARAVAATSTGGEGLLGKGLSASRPDTAEPVSPGELSKSVAVSQFVTDLKIQSRAQARYTDGTATFTSASVRDEFKGPVFREAAAPVETAPTPTRTTTATAISSDFDRWEEALVRKNDGNPVIK